MNLEFRKEESNRINERSSRYDLYSDVEKLLYQTSTELEKVGAHPLLTDVTIDLQSAKKKLSTYFTKNSVVCENYLFHYSLIDEPKENDFILTFDAICIHFGKVNGETNLFDGCWSVIGKDNKDMFLTKSASRKIIGIEPIESTNDYPKMDIKSPLEKQEFLNSLIHSCGGNF